MPGTFSAFTSWPIVVLNTRARLYLKFQRHREIGEVHVRRRDRNRRDGPVADLRVPEQLVVGLVVLHVPGDRMIRVHDLHGERSTPVVHALLRPSDDVDELGPVGKCTVGPVDGDEALVRGVEELEEVGFDLLLLRQRILIAEVEDGDVEREELVARDEVRIGLNHDLLEILARVEDALDLRRGVLPDVPVERVLTGHDDGALRARRRRSALTFRTSRALAVSLALRHERRRDDERERQQSDQACLHGCRFLHAPSRPRCQSNPIAARKTRASRADPVGLGCTRSQLIVAG